MAANFSGPGFILAKSELRGKIMVAPCTRVSRIRILTCRVTTSPTLLSTSGKPKPQKQDGLRGSTGLYMSYSIIFTEISFYPETSILLQIIQIIHMTFWINNQDPTHKGGHLPVLAPGQL